MTWADAVRLAGRSLARRPGRAALTVTAVALAAALLTAMLAVAGTAHGRVLDRLAKGGALAGIRVAAAEADPAQAGADNPRPGPPRVLDDAVLDGIRARADVRLVLPVVASRELVVPTSGRPQERRRGPGVVESVVGVDLRRAAELPVTVLAGRLPTPGSRTEVAVTPAHVERLGIPRAHAASVVGSEVVLGSARGYEEDGRWWSADADVGVSFGSRWTRARVVGLVSQEAAAGGVLASAEHVASSRAWAASGYDGGWLPERARSPYAGAFVVARTVDEVATVRAAIGRLGYSTSAPENLLASVGRYVRVVEIVLAGIGAIALAIAALGIANALLAAVRDRRREIAVLKALGARDRDVLRIFLLEAGAMGAAGGVAGTLLGIAAAGALAAVVDGYLAQHGLGGVPAAVPARVVLVAVAGATALSVVAGVLPARRAARLPAREAVDA